MKIRIFSFCLMLLLSANTALYAAAEEISKQQAINIATDAYPGRVLSIKRDQDVYKVKTLSDSGEVRVVVIDASTGKILPGE